MDVGIKKPVVLIESTDGFRQQKKMFYDPPCLFALFLNLYSVKEITFLENGIGTSPPLFKSR